MFKKAQFFLIVALVFIMTNLSFCLADARCIPPLNVKLAVFSDPHYFAPEYVSEGPAFSAYLAQDRKLLAESKAILSETVHSIRRTNAQIVLITGDLTKDGELLSHIQVAACLRQLREAGKLVLVIPGNHDINNPHAVKYDGSNATPVKQITPDVFERIYYDYGYCQSIARDPYSLSYVVEPVWGLRIIAIDSCSYDDNLINGAPTTHSGLKAQSLDWIRNQLKQAKACNKTVIGMMHHGLIQHFSMQKALFGDFVIDDWENIASEFADLGMKVVFTGHFHAQDIAKKQSPSNNTIYDVETGSLVTYPCPYRIVGLTDSWIDIRTSTIQYIDYNTQGKAFPQYAADYLNTALSEMVPQFLTGVMIKQGMSNSEAVTTVKQLMATQLAPSYTVQDLAVSSLKGHFIGDETCDATISGIVSTLQAFPDLKINMLGNIAYSLLNDSPTADNNVTLNLKPSN